jgi:HK97 gp10 family phage protein
MAFGLGSNSRISRQLQRELDNANRDLVREVKRITKELNKIPKNFRQKHKEEAQKRGAEVFVKAVQSFINDGQDNTRNGSKYLKGNLRNSIQALEFKKTKEMFVGPKVYKTKRKVVGATPKTSNAYYAHMVEYGTAHAAPSPFMRPGFIKGKPEALNKMVRYVKKVVRVYGLYLEREARKNKG